MKVQLETQKEESANTEMLNLVSISISLHYYPFHKIHFSFAWWSPTAVARVTLHSVWFSQHTLVLSL